VLALTLAVMWLAVGPQGQPVYRNAAVFLWTGGWLNLLLAGLNLLPVPPLDGSSILSGLSLRFYQLYQRPQAAMIGMIVILVIFFSGCGGVVIAVFQTLCVLYVDLSGAMFGSPPILDVVY